MDPFEGIRQCKTTAVEHRQGKLYAVSLDVASRSRTGPASFYPVWFWLHSFAAVVKPVSALGRLHGDRPEPLFGCRRNRVSGAALLQRIAVKEGSRKARDRFAPGWRGDVETDADRDYGGPAVCVRFDTGCGAGTLCVTLARRR